jgi:hypothetical protein
VSKNVMPVQTGIQDGFPLSNDKIGIATSLF